MQEDSILYKAKNVFFCYFLTVAHLLTSLNKQTHQPPIRMFICITFSHSHNVPPPYLMLLPQPANTINFLYMQNPQSIILIFWSLQPSPLFIDRYSDIQSNCITFRACNHPNSKPRMCSVIFLVPFNFRNVFLLQMFLVINPLLMLETCFSFLYSTHSSV